MHIESKSRREFLRNATGGVMSLAAASGWKTNLLANPLGFPIGIQLGWIAKDCQMDLDGTFKKLADFGYGEVEAFAPFFDRSPEEFRRLLDAHGLKCPSAHRLTSPLQPGWEKQVEAVKKMGLSYFVTAASVKSLDDCKQSAENLNKMGELCRQAGLQLAIHNHFREFRNFDGVIAYDVIAKETDPKLVTMELDCMWCKFAGQEPVVYLKRYPGRFSMLHIKDMKPGIEPSTEKVEGQPFAEVGHGIINWKPIFAAARRAGVKHYFVEQDRCDRPPLDSAKMSCDYLKSLKV